VVSPFASRILASPDIFGHKKHGPEQSINFVSCHDGFTLNDLVSYNRKHNEGNGEENRDGSDQNLSWNCGIEGPSDDPAVEALRNRQVKNFLALNLLAFGTPMLLMGDEVRRTQGGNNNAYCQDGTISWFDWGLLGRHADVLRFVRFLIAARLMRDMAVNDPGLPLNQIIRQARIEWHGVRLGQPDWGRDSHCIAFTAWSLSGQVAFHLMVNAWREPLEFELPPTRGLSGNRWRRWIDTSLPSPADIVTLAEAPTVTCETYRLTAYSLAVMYSSLSGGAA
jgi:glycogen operon protein